MRAKIKICVKYAEEEVTGKSERLQREQELFNLILIRVCESNDLKSKRSWFILSNIYYIKIYLYIKHLASKYVFIKFHSMSMTVTDMSSVLINLALYRERVCTTSAQEYGGVPNVLNSYFYIC